MTDSAIPVFFDRPRALVRGRFPLARAGTVRADEGGLHFEGDARLSSFLGWWSRPKLGAALVGVIAVGAIGSEVLTFFYGVACALVVLAVRWLPLRRTLHVPWSEVADASPFGNAMRLGTSHGEVLLLPAAHWASGALRELGSRVQGHAAGTNAAPAPKPNRDFARGLLIAVVAFAPLIAARAR